MLQQPAQRMTSISGKFISLEGSEGCGKTTQLNLLVEWLKSLRISPICLREPGGTPLGESIRNLLKHDPNGHGMASQTELLLFAASRAELVRKTIRPALAAGNWVISDRFFDSTAVYQGAGRGLDPVSIEAINRFVTGPTRPDLTLVFDLPSDEALRRATSRPRAAQVVDRMEIEPPEFYEQVRQAYLELAQSEPNRIKVIDARGTREEVFQRFKEEMIHAFPCTLA